MKYISLLCLCLLTFNTSWAQLGEDRTDFDRADTLRGSQRPERTDYEVLKYDLSVDVDIDDKYIAGDNEISFKILHDMPVMQLDLFKNMAVDSITMDGKKLNYRREANAVFIDFSSPLKKDTETSLDFYYSGHPTIAKNPPWDGGFIFTEDDNGKDWVSVAVQGTGASLWYPNKDTQSDEPKEAEIHVTTPKDLMNVSNGRLTDKTEHDNGSMTWSWKVVNPINNYNLVLNIGDYVHFSDQFKDVDMNYYVLRDHLDKAKKQFKQAKSMLKCFSKKFGDYPFKEDGYKLIETPYLGMEHQSGIGYGNHYENGYLGRDLSQTGVGLKWDYIIVHESGHEWFGNSITAADIADMWIHEAFTSYAESVYIECQFGKEDALTYLKGTRKTRINNDAPIIGPYGVNEEGSGDMYFKGANMLHTLRSVIADDKNWWNLLKRFHSHFRHQITDTEEVVGYFAGHIDKMNTKAFFDQYLRYADLPELRFKTEDNHLWYRWQVDTEKGFDMPIDVKINGKAQRLHPTDIWHKLDKSVDLEAIDVDTDNFLIKVRK